MTARNVKMSAKNPATPVMTAPLANMTPSASPEARPSPLREHGLGLHHNDTVRGVRHESGQGGTQVVVDPILVEGQVEKGDAEPQRPHHEELAPQTPIQQASRQRAKGAAQHQGPSPGPVAGRIKALVREVLGQQAHEVLQGGRPRDHVEDEDSGRDDECAPSQRAPARFRVVRLLGTATDLTGGMGRCSRYCMTATMGNTARAM